MRRRGLTFALALLLLAPACAGNRAYLEWRPGLSAIDFEGLYEISFDEYQAFYDEAIANTLFDRFHGQADPGAAIAMTEIGEALAGSAGGDPRGYAIVELRGDGSVSLTGDRGAAHAGTVDWFAATPDRGWAALVTGTKLAVATGAGASTGIELGSLLGTGLGGYQWLMLERDGELSVFALPELGGAVTANEPGYVFAFRYLPGTREVWDISVGRIAVTI